MTERLTIEEAKHNPRRIYVASSWRNDRYPFIVSELRRWGHDVYDFRNPGPGNHGFHWSEIDPDWKRWTPAQFKDALDHELAVTGFGCDFAALQWADTVVLVHPCGRSAHLEAGWAAGAGRELHVLLALGDEPELMLKMATGIHSGVLNLLLALGEPLTSRNASGG